MSQQEIIEEIRRLSVKERVVLIEAISGSLREDLETVKNEDISVSREKSERPETQDADQDRATISQRLSGILKFDGDVPTDDEVKDAYTDYLLEKYS